MSRYADQISGEYRMLRDKVWWNRHRAAGSPPEGEDHAVRIERRYGLAYLDPGDQVEWGITQGRMQALAWVLGARWDEAGDT